MYLIPRHGKLKGQYDTGSQLDHANNASSAGQSEDSLSDDIDQLFELTRILVLVISNHVPNVSERDYPSKQISK